MSAGLAHDLNNALTCVFADMEVLSEGLGAARHASRAGAADGDIDLSLLLERCAQWAKEIRENLDAAGRYSRELQSVLRSGAQPDPRVPSAELAAAIHRSLRASAADLRGTQVTVFVEPVLVGVGEDVVVRILLNLLRNAAQAFAQEELSRGARSQVEVRTSVGETTVTCDVRDNGPGVPAEILPHLFEASTTTKSWQDGSGVGLASSRALARAAGGDMALVETGPRGTTFRLALPRIA
jgi:C4-dicarboxylate-specific signal transduction histidine kinase